MRTWAIYFQRPILLQFLLGIPSGLPLALTASTLTFWLAESGVNKAAIGIFALVAMPYAFKFLWAPIMDGITLPFLGKRRGWMMLTQLMMVAALLLMAFSNPADAPFITGLFAFLLAFSSASHDIVKDAYRVEALPVEMQGAGSGAFVFGYRIGMLASTAGALYLAEFFGWQFTYFAMAVAMLVLCLSVLIIKEPSSHQQPTTSNQQPLAWLSTYVLTPFVEFLTRPGAILILLFIVFYRMADAFLGIMAGPFYLELGFEKTQIAAIVKLYGVIATVIGSLVGGAIVYRLGVIRSLWVGGIAASISNLAFIWQAHVGAEPYALALTISLDNLSGGLATSAFVAYMGSLVNLRFTATQFALLSSVSAVGRTFLTVPAGYAATALGWDLFFVSSTLIGLPALMLLWWLGKETTNRAVK